MSTKISTHGTIAPPVVYPAQHADLSVASRGETCARAGRDVVDVSRPAAVTGARLLSLSYIPLPPKGTYNMIIVELFIPCNTINREIK